jgi:hypothetical protein
MAGAETVAWFGMGTVTSSRKGKGAAAKRPASASARPVKSKGAAAGGPGKVPARPVSASAPAPVTSKSNTHGTAAAPVREAAAKTVAAPAPAPERSPPALPIPIASFTF